MNRIFSTIISMMLVLSIYNTGQATAGLKAGASAGLMQRAGVAAVKFAPRQIREANKKLRYTINAQYPQAIGAGQDERLMKLNQELKNLITKEVSDFKKDFQAPEEPMGEMVSSYDSAYSVILATNNLVSISFGISTFGEGAAHPNHSTLVFNYDLNAGRVLSLSDLFKPDSSYLSVISKYAIAQLRKKFSPDPDMDWIESGAGAKEENYKAWSLTRSGLQVTFDPYQVASYAEGEHVVVVPYSVLKNLIDPNGPLPAITTQQRGMTK